METVDSTNYSKKCIVSQSIEAFDIGEISKGKEGAKICSPIAAATWTVEIPILNKSANDEGGAPVVTNLKKNVSLISAPMLSLI